MTPLKKTIFVTDGSEFENGEFLHDIYRACSLDLWHDLEYETAIPCACYYCRTTVDVICDVLMERAFNA